MIDEQILQQAVKRIVAAAQPSRVILFGSHGRDQADAGSDLDLMVIKPQVPDKYMEMIRLHKQCAMSGQGGPAGVFRGGIRATQRGSGHHALLDTRGRESPV